MTTARAPHQIIADLVTSYELADDAEVLAALAAHPALADESDSIWNLDEYWVDVAYPYVALADVSALRRLRAAIRPLLDRACYGDPGEIMRGLRNSLAAIVKPNWTVLTEICLDAARSPRLGTKLWALDLLSVLEDPRARSLFEEAARDAPTDIKAVANRGLKRLASAG